MNIDDIPDYPITSLVINLVHHLIAVAIYCEAIAYGGLLGIFSIGKLAIFFLDVSNMDILLAAWWFIAVVFAFMSVAFGLRGIFGVLALILGHSGYGFPDFTIIKLHRQAIS